MLSIIALLCPSAIGVKVVEALTKKRSYKDLSYYYVILLLISTIINIVISYLFFTISSDLALHLNTYPILWIKYVVISVVVNIVLGVFISMITKNISISMIVKDKKNEKNNK